ncbi:MAG: hypothetical protein FWH19_04830, partial [Treponema sp.]|nr:hypothetical protein [Treponema sp.]
PDMEGIRVRLNYADGTSAEETNVRNFITVPAILENGIEEVRFFHVNGASAAVSDVFTPSYVYKLTNAYLTGFATKQDYFEDDIPDFRGLMLHGVYAPRSLDNPVAPVRVIPMTTAREYNWFDTWEKYYAAGVRKLIDPQEKRIFYRVADNNPPDANGDPVIDGNSWFVSFGFTNFFEVDRLTYLPESSGQMGPYTADPAVEANRYWPVDRADTIDSAAWWLEQAAAADIRFRVSYLNTTRTKDITMREYLYALERDKATYPMLPNLVQIIAEIPVSTRLVYFAPFLNDKNTLVTTNRFPNSAVVELDVYLMEELEIDFTAENHQQFLPEVIYGSGSELDFRRSWKRHRVINYVYIDPNNRNNTMRVPVPFDPELENSSGEGIFGPGNNMIFLDFTTARDNPEELGEISLAEIVITVAVPESGGGGTENMEDTFWILPTGREVR